MPKFEGWIFECDQCGLREDNEDCIVPQGWVEDEETEELLCHICLRQLRDREED